MSHDDDTAELMRRALGSAFPVTERKMFGGLGFMMDGNMLCGVVSRKMGGGAIFRVGKDAEAAALKVQGTRRFGGTGRPMGGFIACDAELLEDEERRDTLLNMAAAYVGSLPAK